MNAEIGGRLDNPRRDDIMSICSEWRGRMGRNKKPRMVGHTPPAAVFKPAGVPARTLQWLRLTLDQYEALRLADYEGLSQEEVAERLGVSRPTVGRILESARRTGRGGPRARARPSPSRAGRCAGGPAAGRGHGPGRHGRAWDNTEDGSMRGGRGEVVEGRRRKGRRWRRRTGSRQGSRPWPSGWLAQGPGGTCVCPACGETAAHVRGTPCTEQKCPKCGAQMTRERK